MTRTAISYNPEHTKHTSFGHPESHNRLEAIHDHLRTSGLLDRTTPIGAEPVADPSLTSVHRASYLAMLKASRSDRTVWLDPDTYLTPSSLEIARRATGATLACVDAVMQGEVTNAFALNRPPGHHATPSRAMGFCLFNHVAAAARHAQTHHGIGRVAIVDFDVHHGNGTQDIFYEDPSVLFLSVHESPLFPGTGRREERGSGPGLGYTVNIPIPAGCADASYGEVFERVVLPAVDAFAPELVLVSAGYDSHWRDPLANQNVTISGFSDMVRGLLTLADRHCSGRLVACLEGGYDLQMLPWSVQATLELMLDPSATPADPFPAPDVSPPDLDALLSEIANDLKPLR